MQRSGCSACTEAWPQTKQIVEGTETIQLQHCKSKPQPCAPGSNPSSSFKSCSSWPGDGHDVFTAMQGATVTHCGPISTRKDYHMYCWGKANISDFWERKSSLIAPCCDKPALHRHSLIALPQTSLRKLMDLAHSYTIFT